MDCARTQRPAGKRCFLCMTVVLLLAPQITRAQQLGGTFPVEERQTAVARVVPGEFVRARLTDGSRAGGPLVGATPVTFTLGPSVAYSDNQYIVRLVNVDSLWVRAYSSRRGAMIGGGVGGLLGLRADDQTRHILAVARSADQHRGSRGGARDIAQKSRGASPVLELEIAVVAYDSDMTCGDVEILTRVGIDRSVCGQAEVRRRRRPARRSRSRLRAHRLPG